jgi:hypothetical protein
MGGTKDIDQTVRAWARENEPDLYNYSSPSSWYRAALSGGVIVRSEYDLMFTYYGDRWCYTGD